MTRLVEFLKENFGIDWAKNAKLVKIDIVKMILVYTEKNSLVLKLNEEKTEVNLKIDDGRTDKLIAKMYANKLNIYNKFYHESSNAKEEFIKALVEPDDQREEGVQPKSIRNRL